MFKQRFVTALVIALLFASALVFFSATDFISAMAIIVLIAGWEWTHLAKLESTFEKSVFLLGLIATMIVAAHYIGFYGEYTPLIVFQICVATMALWALIFLWLQGYPSSAILWSSRPVMVILGVVLLTTTWVSLAALTFLENGRFILLLAVTIIVLADVGGYLFGKAFGRHKLAPTISPGKTWEGLFGGMALQILLVLGLVLNIEITSVLNLCFLIFPVAIFSVIGDLFESMLKRHRGVKDSSNLLPGHGGFLDRLDGVMAALPLFFVILTKASPF
jgi:phosphatidate cytidylyltransferase